MRAIGFQLGLRGDLCMATVAARSFKEQHPNSHLTLGIGPQFADMLPLFAHHPYIDDVHIYSTYDGWPGEKDKEYLRRAGYDIVFNGMPPHRDEWWKYRHQYAEAAHMCGLPIPTDIIPILTKWFDIPHTVRWFEMPHSLSQTVAFAPFAGFYAPNNDKRLSVEQAQAIVNFLRRLDFQVLQLGGMDEPELKDAIRLDTNYFDSVRYMLGCKFLIHTDTGMGHIAGAYNHPSIGIYGARYYGLDLVKNIQPLHSNFQAVVADTVAQIELDKVYQAVYNRLTV